MARKSENRTVLTNQRVAKLQPRIVDGQAKDTFIWDETVPALAVRVRPSGTKSFLVRFMDGTRQRWLTLEIQPPAGSVAQAREEAKKLLGRKSQGDDPARARDHRRKVGTVAELVQRFEEEQRPRLKLKTWVEYSRQFQAIIVPAIGTIPVSDVDRADLDRIHRSLKDRPILSNRVHALLHRLFALSVRWGLRESNPAEGHEKRKEQPRKRFLSALELSALGEAIGSAHADNSIPARALDAIEGLLLTGLRVRELLGLRWKDLDWETGTIHLEDTKTGPRDASLGKALRVLLESRKPAKATQLSSWVFPAPENPAKPLCYAKLREHWIALTAKAKINSAHIHDLRRTAGTHAISELSMSEEVLAKVLGHKGTQATKVYALVAGEARAKATEQVGELMAAKLRAKKKA